LVAPAINFGSKKLFCPQSVADEELVPGKKAHSDDTDTFDTFDTFDTLKHFWM
jgi:hypothetical protein